MNRLGSILILAAFALTAAGCPKEDRGASKGPGPAASAAPTMESSSGPASLPTRPASTEPTPKAADGAPAAAGETVVQYRWSGGLSIYRFYALTVRGADTAKVTFVVAPLRQDEKRVEDTLDAAQFAELKSLFDKVNFDGIGQKPRNVRILDIGQTVISREGGGHAKKEVLENGNTTIDGDDAALKAWLDEHVRLYLDRAGVGLKPRASSPTPTPAPMR